MPLHSTIEPPFSISAVPPPLGHAGGRTLAASVVSLSGAKTRKRTEVAVGVDGEGIFLYSLRNSRLVTSYALPPQASFTAAPCSVYRKASAQQPSCRFTYASVAASSPGGKSELLCFVEHAQRSGDEHATRQSYSPPTAAPIVSIEILPDLFSTNQDGSHDVLVVFQNGFVARLSAELEDVRWACSLAERNQHGTTTSCHIEFVSLTDATTALRGLLRGRPDVAAVLNRSRDGSAHLDAVPVLCVVGSSCERAQNDGRTLHLFQLAPQPADHASTHAPPVAHLHCWDFPEAAPPRAIPNASYSLHAPLGVLYQLSDGALTTYNFSRTVPTITSDLEPFGGPMDSFVRIGAELVLVTSSRSCCIYDVKYNSVQALAAAGDSSPAGGRSKRKRSETEAVAEPSPSFRAVAYYAESGLVVGLKDKELVGVHVHAAHPRKRTKHQHPRLIDAIGRGVPRASQSLSGQDAPAWQGTMRRLDHCAANGQVAEFERHLASALGIPFADQTDVDTAAGSSSHDVVPREWHLSPAVLALHRRSRRHQLLYVLGKMFRWTDPARTTGSVASSISIDFFPPNAFRWVLLSGHLTKESIQQALLTAPADLRDRTRTIIDGDLVKAMVDYDAEMHMLYSVLNESAFLPVGEVVQAIHFLLESFEDGQDGHLAPAAAHPASEQEAEAECASELEAATQDLDHALSVLDHGLVVRSHSLRPALMRLHRFPAPLTTSTLRDMVPRRDLESLIRILHFELRNGGWASPYDFADPPRAEADEIPGDTSDHAIAIIASLLSCALDAVGAAALMSATNGFLSSDGAEELVNSLYEDTTLALKGFWEASFMRGLLGEFLRYAAQVARNQPPAEERLREQGKPFAMAQPADGAALPMLPLGGKMESTVESKRMKGGRKVLRSARERGMLVSKTVAPYSIERVDI